MKNWLFTIVVFLLLAGAATAGGVYWYSQPAASDAQTWKMATVQRGELVVTISATGTLEPEEVVDVGAQVAGKIQEFGREPDSQKMIDYGSVVEPDTVLARIDPSLYEEEVNFATAQVGKSTAKLHQTRAQVQEAQANVKRAEADLVQLKAKLHQAERDWARAQKLFPTGAFTPEQYDNSQALHETAKAGVAVGEAAIVQAECAVNTTRATEEEADADVASAQASLNRASKNLEYTTIRAPIKGVIIDRRVNIGQTVVASLNAPSLFLIAKDLRRLQVWASVNEADIGRLRTGQNVTFNVDAFPGEPFAGKVKQIRLNATMTQNVVTYTVIVDVDNSQNKLLPYLTANVKFEVARRSDVCLVPNTALRWKPRPEQIAPAFRNGNPPKAAVWVRSGELVRPLPVTVGDTDGTATEVSGEGLTDGLELVVGETRRDATDKPPEKVVNPLAPKVYSGKQG